MNTNLQVTFPGTCDEAFAFYEQTFGGKRLITMHYGDLPEGTPVPEGAKDLVMHTSMKLGTLTLMGADMPLERRGPVGGFEISLDTPDEAEVARMFTALSEGGTVTMPLGPTFWTPLFGMVTDKFGVGWMLSVPGPEPA
jgi:PhnB protein